MCVPRKTRYETAVEIARGYGDVDEGDVKRSAKHIFARMITGGATIGKVNGKLVVHRDRIRPKLPKERAD